MVTCQKQPALGCVYKMVELNGIPRIKLSQEVGKVTIPGKKTAYRLYGTDGCALIDLMQRSLEDIPKVDKATLCRHPFQECKRAYVKPSHVELLHKVLKIDIPCSTKSCKFSFQICWENGKICHPLPTLQQIRNRVQKSLRTLRRDHKRSLNPTPYKVIETHHKK